MRGPIENIAVIGTGVIGAGWIIRFLFNQKTICVYDPQLKQKKFLENEIKRAKPILKKIYKKNINLSKQLKFCKSIKETVKNADLIQENAPENEILKIKIVKDMHDTKRDTFNVATKHLLAEDAGAEGSTVVLDILSNGFKFRTSNGDRNASGATYIYMAFAEEPLVANVGNSIPATAR